MIDVFKKDFIFIPIDKKSALKELFIINNYKYKI